MARPDVNALVERMRWRAKENRAPWLNEVADALEAVEAERARLEEGIRDAVNHLANGGSSREAVGLALLASLNPEANDRS